MLTCREYYSLRFSYALFGHPQLHRPISSGDALTSLSSVECRGLQLNFEEASPREGAGDAKEEIRYGAKG